MVALSSPDTMLSTKFAEYLDSGVSSCENIGMNTKKLAGQVRDVITQLNQILADPTAQDEVTPEMQTAKRRAEAGCCCYCGEPGRKFVNFNRCERTLLHLRQR